MADDLDLETGDQSAADRILGGGSSSRGSRGKRGSSDTSGKREDSSVASKLDDAFTRLAEQCEARQDFELAEALQRDKEAMSRGLVSMTRAITVLRSPLIWFLALLEPVLAFWHTGGIVLRRLFGWRYNRRVKRAAAAAGMTPEEYVAAGYPEYTAEPEVVQ